MRIRTLNVFISVVTAIVEAFSDVKKPHKLIYTERLRLYLSYSIYVYGTSFMVHSHCTVTGPGPVQGPSGKYSTMLCRNVHTDPRHGQGPGLIVYYCATCSSIPCTGSSPVNMQCE